MSIMNVVFTGAARDKYGQTVLRANLIKQAQQSGFRVQPSVNSETQFLVASRFDTVKSRQAQQRGLTVLTYSTFIAMLGGSVPEVSKKSDSFVDVLAQPEQSVEDWV